MPANPAAADTPVRVTAGPVMLDGNLVVPDGAGGVVLFAHGSGSGRHSPRNQFVARRLQADGLATLLIDLLTEDEERAEARTRHLRFDIPASSLPDGVKERLLATRDSRNEMIV